MDRRIGNLVFHTARNGVFAVIVADSRRCGRKKGNTAAVHQLIQHDAERKDIRTGIIDRIAVNLGRHIIISAFFGEFAAGGFNAARYAEIAELVVAVGRDENVGGLDIAVNDFVFGAHFERAADIDAEPDHIAFGRRMRSIIFV